MDTLKACTSPNASVEGYCCLPVAAYLEGDTPYQPVAFQNLSGNLMLS